jgi:flagellar FliL protein
VAKEENKLPEGLAEAAQDGTETGDAAAQGAPNKKKRLIIIAAAALVALGGGGGAYMMLAGGGDAPAHGEEAAEEAEEGAETFVDVPPMTVNLRTADGASRFLKVHLMLVPGKAEAEAITKKLPLVIDSYQLFLRELRPEDLSGSAATFRIKEELLVRGNAALGAGAVRDVLIQDLVQQ